MVDKDQDGSPLPPKLDLRKSGVIKPQDATSPEEPETIKPKAVPVSPPTPSASGTKAPSSTPPAKPRSTTAPIVIPKPQGGAKPVTRPSSAGPKAMRPSSVKSAVPAKPARESVEPESGGGQEPETKSGTSKITLSRAKPGAPAAARPEPVTTVSSKKETTKIPLEAAKPKPVGTAGSAGTPSSLLISSPGDTAQIPAVPKAKAAGVADKRKTSRIPLEAALGEETVADDEDSTPKTIRIKRPGGSGPTAKPVAARPVKAKPISPRAPSTAEAASMAEEASEPEGEDSPTRKKTIVVKRPQSGGAKKLSLSKPKGAAIPGTAAAAVVQPAAVKTDEPGVVSGIIAIAAVLVVSALIYMFAAQVIGPDKSQVSYAVGAPNLAFPGKIKQQ